MTILVNSYQTSGTSQAVTVPYQSKPFLGIIFIQFATGSIGSGNVSPSWGAPPQSSGAGGGAAIFKHAFDDPVSPTDALLTPTVSGGITGGPLLVIAMSVSSDSTTGVYNISERALSTNTNWSGNLVPATGNIVESSNLSTDIEILGFVSAFLTNVTAGTATVVPNGTLAEVSEVDATGRAWAIEVCRESSLPSSGTTKTVTVDGTGSGGTKRIDGFTGTWYIASTFVRAINRWHVDDAVHW